MSLVEKSERTKMKMYHRQDLVALDDLGVSMGYKSGDDVCFFSGQMIDANAFIYHVCVPTIQ